MKPGRSFTIDHISAALWRQVLRVADELDLEKGGYFDARSGCLNLWAGPEDKPAGWPEEVPITEGALSYPRSFVGSIHLEWPRDSSDRALPEKLPVVLEICCRDVAEWCRTHPTSDGPSLRSPRKLGQPHPETYRVKGDVAWARRHWRQLLDRAGELAPKLPRLGPWQPVPDAHCPRCGHELARLLRPPAELASWRYFCAHCRTLTVSAEELPRLLESLPEGAIGVVGAIPFPTKAR